MFLELSALHVVLTCYHYLQSRSIYFPFIVNASPVKCVEVIAGKSGLHELNLEINSRKRWGWAKACVMTNAVFYRWNVGQHHDFILFVDHSQAGAELRPDLFGGQLLFKCMVVLRYLYVGSFLMNGMVLFTNVCAGVCVRFLLFGLS